MLTFRKRKDNKYRVYSDTAYMKIGSKDNKKFLETDYGIISQEEKIVIGKVKDIQYSKGAVIVSIY